MERRIIASFKASKRLVGSSSKSTRSALRRNTRAKPIRWRSPSAYTVAQLAYLSIKAIGQGINEIKHGGLGESLTQTSIETVSCCHLNGIALCRLRRQPLLSGINGLGTHFPIACNICSFNLGLRQSNQQIVSDRAIKQVGFLAHHGLNTSASMHIDLEAAACRTTSPDRAADPSSAAAA